MPYRSFNDFTKLQPNFSDYIVGFNPLRGEFRTTIYSLNQLITGGGYELYTFIASNSGLWSSTYSIANQLSAVINSFPTTYLALTGGTITGNLVINGSLTALGDTTFIDTLFTTTSALSVINKGYGPALYIWQGPGPGDIASFYDGDGVEVLHVGNALNPVANGVVGIKESFPTETLTVRGTVSAQKGLSATNIHSFGKILSGNKDISDYFGSNLAQTAYGLAQSTYTTTRTNSASWTAASSKGLVFSILFSS